MEKRFRYVVLEKSHLIFKDFWTDADESAATLDFDIDNQNSFWFLTQKEKEEDIKVEWW